MIMFKRAQATCCLKKLFEDSFKRLTIINFLIVFEAKNWTDLQKTFIFVS